MKTSNDKTLYTEDSIISLNPRDFTRLRPSTYLGSNEYSTQLVREVFANALDEHNINHGDLIKVSIDTKTNEYTVEDQGQGFPINSVREDGKTVFEAAFSVLNTSGKYDDSKDGIYSGSSLGCNGVGSKIVTFLSLVTDITTFNSSGTEHIIFKDGLFEKRDASKKPIEKSGTIIKWIPDPQFFQNKEANINDLKKLFEDISALCPRLTIEFTVDGKTITYHTADGILELLNKKIGNKEILNKRFTLRKEVENELFDIALTYTSDYSENVIAYANYGLTESGIHIGTVKACLTNQLNKYARDNNLLKAKDDNLIQSEVSEGLFVVFNIKTSNVKYDSQTKTKIVDLNKTLITTVMNNDFAMWLTNNPKDAKAIIDKALIARKAREAAQKAKDAARGLKAVKKDRFLDLPSKLIDANPRDHDRTKCTLYLVEGDSASSGIVSKRDGERHGIMPLRGKILSVRKATVQDMYKNQEISNIVKSLGLDVNAEAYTLTYNLKKLRYHKIVLLEDGDSDGGAIRMLLITLLWRLCPELVINGHVYSSRPPLFKVTDSKNNYSYCTDEKALERFKSTHKKEKLIVNRLKGLGEMSPDELYECMIKDGNDNVMQITVDDVDEADKTLETFMGVEVSDRRAYYEQHYNDVEIEIE